MTTISTLQVRQSLGDILNRVHLRHDEFIIERKGRPLAAVIPVGKLQALRAGSAAYLLSWFERKTAPETQAQADTLANQIKHRSRKPRR